MELADNGLEAMNTTRFLAFATKEPAGDRIKRGDLVILDEVGMTSTAELAATSRLVAGAGGMAVLHRRRRTAGRDRRGRDAGAAGRRQRLFRADRRWASSTRRGPSAAGAPS
jgi:hypothetical protein